MVTLSVSPTTFVALAAGDLKSASVTANGAWSVTQKSGSGWVSCKTSATSGNGTVTFSIAPNGKSESRVSTNVITAAGNTEHPKSVEVVITQEEGSPSYVYRYNLVDGRAVITNYIGTGGDIIIPAEINGYTVSQIGSKAFYQNTLITSVVIPSSVTSIGSSAFCDCSSLTNMIISSGVISIGDGAFSDCSGLKSATIPSTVTNVGESAFYDCRSLTSITIPSSVTSIGDRAFYMCHGLTNARMSIGITTIGDEAFSYCETMKSVTIPSSVRKIGSSVFHWCSGLTNVTMSTGVTTIGQKMFSCCSNLKTIVIPSSVTCIGYMAFADFNGLSSIVIPSSVTNIDDWAFYNCSNLKDVVIPSSVTSIGSYAFSLCSGLERVEIPSSVACIGDSAFANCGGLTSVTSVKMSIDVMYITIGDRAFYNCGKLTNVTMPSRVWYIGNNAFDECDSLETIYVEEGNADSVRRALENSGMSKWDILGIEFEKKTVLDFPCEVVDGKAVITNYTGTGGDVELPSVIAGATVVEIGKNAFRNSSSITSIKIPDSVTNICDYAFYKCTGLTNVTISSNVESIGRYAFCRCSGLMNVMIPSNVVSIGSCAFYRCNGLLSVTIPSSVTKMGDIAFAECSSLTKLTVCGKLPVTFASNKWGCYLSNDKVWVANANYLYWKNIWGDGLNLLGPIVPYNITYSPGDYCQGDERHSVKTNEIDCVLASSLFTRRGYTQTGWSETDGAVVGDFAFGDTYSEDRAITLYPACTANVYRIEFDFQIGVGGTVTTNVVYDHTLPNIAIPILAGYAFGGYYADVGCTGKQYYSESGVGIVPWDLIAETTLYAKWTKVKSDFLYRVENDSAIITNYVGSGGDIQVPSKIEGYDVVEIGARAFYNAPISSIAIPEGVTTIGDYAFKYSDIISVQLPTSLVTIGNDAFSGCYYLKSVHLPSGVRMLGDGIQNCGFDYDRSLETFTVSSDNEWFTAVNGVLFSKDMRELVKYPAAMDNAKYKIHDSITNIWDGAFLDCDNLISIQISEGVTDIGEWAFYTCNALTNVSLPGTLKTIGNGAFMNCTNLRALTVPEAVLDMPMAVMKNLTLTNLTLLGRCGTGKNADKRWGATVVNSNIWVKAIDYEYWTGILGDGLNVLPGSKMIVKIPKPTKVEGLVYTGAEQTGCADFGTCILVSGSTSATTAGEYPVVFRLPIKTITTMYTWSDGSTDDASFSWSISPRDVADASVSFAQLPDQSHTGTAITPAVTMTFGGVVRIEGSDYSLAYSNNIDAGTANVTVVGRGNFTGTKVLAFNIVAEPNKDFRYKVVDGKAVITNYAGKGGDVFVPSKIDGYDVVDISSKAFLGNKTITSVAIPKGVTSVRTMAFEFCTYLTNVTISASVQSIGSSAFSWCNSLTDVLIPSNVTSIGSSAFAYCSGLRGVTISEGVTSVGSSAFYYCSSMTNVIIPSSVKMIGNSAFVNCSGLRSITISEGVTSIGSSAFCWCKGLTSVMIPSSVTSIATEAFGGCTSLTNFVVDPYNPNYSSIDGFLVTKSGETLISGRNGNVQIPTGITSIDDYSFYGLYGLTNVTIPLSVISVGRYAFAYCKGLESVTIPLSVRSIEEHTFYSCSGLTNLTISSVVTNIGNYAFSYCKGLKNVTIPSSVASIGTHAFDSCIALTNVTISSDVTSIGTYAFSRCKGLTTVTIPSSVMSIGHDAFYGCSILTVVYVDIGDTDRVSGLIEDSGLDCESITFIEHSDTDPIPEIVKPTSIQIKSVLGRADDPMLAERITNETEYVAFREWSGKVKQEKGGSTTVGASGVMAAPNAWLSYALGSETLIETVPADSDLKVEAFEPKSGEDGKFDFTVSVEGVAVGDAATTDAQRERVKENLKQVFGLEGGTSLEAGGMSSANVDITFGTPQDGKVKFTAGPKDTGAKTFFMKVKVTP